MELVAVLFDPVCLGLHTIKKKIDGAELGMTH
jgi:hypothetical protein